MKIITTNNFVLLAQSPFGNYAFQFLMEKLKSNELNEIFLFLNENIFKNKFGKIVISKAFNYMNKEIKNKFEFELVNNINNGIYYHKEKNRIKKFLV